jgi:hypothetical protein
MPIDWDMFNPAQIQQRLVNIGLQLARTVGTGLNLVNAILDVHPDLERTDVGRAVKTVGAGIVAAREAMQGPGDAPIDIAGLPVAPAGFFSGDETDRVIAMADVSFEAFNSDNDATPHEEKKWDVRVNCSEASTIDELIECIEQQFETYQEIGPDISLNAYTNLQITLFFMAKRF